MIRLLYWIFLFYFTLLYVNCRTVNITLTRRTNLTNFRNILNLFLNFSNCPPRTYAISIIPYNETAPFESPVGKNEYFPNIHLVFGPLHYFTPTYYGFQPNKLFFKFMNSYVMEFVMDYPLQLELMLTAVNTAVEKDANKSVVFVLNGSRVDLMEPWKPYNPMPYLSTFKGSINVQLYFNRGDGVRICSKILSSRTATIAMNLNRAGALDVLTACNDKNLLYWRMRWLVFFSSLSFASNITYRHLPMRSNFTLFDYSKSNDFNFTEPQVITSEQDILQSDIAYIVVRLMDYSECNQPRPNIVNLRTGLYSFGSDPVSRISWDLDIYRNNGTHFNNVGNIDIKNRSIKINPGPPVNFINNAENLVIEMRVKPFRVAIMNEKPFAYIDYVNGTQVQTGYCVDMIKRILDNLNVTSNISFYNYSNGILVNDKLTGMLGLLQNGQADIAVGPITLNTYFKSLVDFTNPFLSYKVAIIYKVNETKIYSDIFEFINAFHWHVWILIVLSCIIYAVALTLVNMISPNEAKFGFLYSFLFTMGSMVQGVTTSLPDKISGRIVVVFWWIFNIVILLTYVANYGAILTNRRMQATINQLSDLFQQNQYSYATVTGSAIEYYLQTSPYSDIENVYQVIRNQYLSFMATTTENAMKTVSQGNFAFIYSDVVLKSYTNIPCMKVTNGADSFSYSYALPLNSDFTNIFNDQMGSLPPSFIQSLNTKYFTPSVQPVCSPSNWLTKILDILGYPFLPNIIDSLNIDKFAGIFVIMLIGIVIALFVAIIEFIVRKCKKGD